MKIIFSPLANGKLKILLEFLKIEWGESAKIKFLSNLKSGLDKTELFPESNFSSSEFEGLYKLVITKQTSLYYRIKEGNIEVITILDNRQDPNKIEQEIKKLI